MGNTVLHKAKRAKKDEFYTRMEDIEAELQHYEHHFAGKTVFCNCDDPYESNFFKYFALKFNELKLRKLIATCYVDSPIAQLELQLDDDDLAANEGDEPREKKPYKVVITEVKDVTGDGNVDMADVEHLIKNGKNVRTELKGDRKYGAGDFRSAECVELLKEADIVVTNPPFSLFREYVAQLVKYDKKFLILGNQNAITYKEVFPLLKEDKMWLGCNNGDMAFRVPDYFEPRETRYWVDETGQKWRSLGNIAWFTNLDMQKRHTPLQLATMENNIRFSKHKEVRGQKYRHYDNYDAIEVPFTDAIPSDFAGVMGVPITFLDKYCPEQFEIVGASDNGAIDEAYKLPHFKRHNEPYIEGKKAYKRLFIRAKHPQPRTE